MKKIKKRYKKKEGSPFYKKSTFQILLLSLFAFLFLFIYLVFNPFYQLSDIHVVGSQLTSDENIENLIKNKASRNLILSSSSLILISNHKIQKEIIDSYPHIEKATVDKIFPDKIEIEITERGKEAVWCENYEDRECFEIDSAGIAFQPVDQKESFYILRSYPEEVVLGDRVLPEKKIELIFQIKEKIEDDFFEVESISLPHPYSAFVKTGDEFDIYFNLNNDLSNQMERLGILLEKEIRDMTDLEYIDLRYGARVFYKNR